MNRRHLIHSMVALTVASLLPLGASAATGSSASGAKSTAHHASMGAFWSHKKVDLNTATRDQLIALPVVNAPIADKIIENRPYRNTRELLSKGVVTKQEYSKLHNRVTARQSTESKESKATGK